MRSHDNSTSQRVKISKSLNLVALERVLGKMIFGFTSAFRRFDAPINHKCSGSAKSISKLELEGGVIEATTSTVAILSI